MSFNNLSLTDEATFALNVSLSVARDSGHSEAKLTHLASALFFMDESIGCTVVATAGQLISRTINMKRLKRNIEKLIQKTPSEDLLPIEAKLASPLETLLSSEEKQKSDGKISIEDLLLIIYRDTSVSQILDGKYKLSTEILSKLFAENRIHDRLGKYSIDLLKAARGRHEEIRDTVKILSSSSINNVCLVGEPHVDVIAVVEGLALRISQGIVPESVDASLRALNLDSFINDTNRLDEMQARFQEVLNDVKELEGRIIFFKDKLHFVLGGESVEGMNAAALLRPYIENDDIRMIGAIYTEDFTSCIKDDSVFAQSFHKLVVDDLSHEPVLHATEMAAVHEVNLDSSCDGLNESRSLFDGNVSFGITTSLANAAQLSDRYILMNHISAPSNSDLQKDGSRRTLLRPQQTVSERFLSMKHDSQETAAFHAETSTLDKKYPNRISRPASIVALERKIAVLEMEREILKKPKNEADETQNLAILNEISKLKHSLEPCLIKWQAQHVKELKSAKRNLESLENKALHAERAGDFDKAASLKFGTIPALKTRIQE